LDSIERSYSRSPICSSTILRLASVTVYFLVVIYRFKLSQELFEIFSQAFLSSVVGTPSSGLPKLAHPRPLHERAIRGAFDQAPFRFSFHI
jgi:hypothetical protein